MALKWIDRTPERPDRYLDWDLLQRTAAGSPMDEWCSVLVQLWAATGPDPAANLQTLYDALPIGGTPPTPTVNATADEARLINRRIAELRGGTLVPTGSEDSRLAFFVYMPEREAYANGQYKHAAHYRIRLVSPPIRGLRVDQPPPPMPVLEALRLAGKAAPEVAVGIIDNAIAFANERFRRRNPGDDRDATGSRVENIWIQFVEEVDESPDRRVLFGRRLERSEIEAALRSSAATSGVINEDVVYAATGAVDFLTDRRQSAALRGSHGTHVMDLACGYASDDPAGYRRPILAVQLPEPAKLGTTGVTTASYVLQGLRQILLWADEIRPDIPLVVNFSYGYYAGPKDGSQTLERELLRLIEQRAAPTVLVLPAGNTYRDRVTARMTLSPGAEGGVDWMILPDCGTPSFLEIWLDTAASRSPVGLELSIPGTGLLAMAMPRDGMAKVLDANGKPIGAIYFDARAIGSTRSRIFVAISPTKTNKRNVAVAPSGSWGVKLKNTSTSDVAAHLYIQREDTPAGSEPPGRQSYFEHRDAFGWDRETGNYDRLEPSCPITHLETLTALASMSTAVVVGSAFAEKDGNTRLPTLYTSSGPTPARPGPDFAAVSDDDRALPGVIAAGTRSGSYVTFYGTSIAAPQLARRLADAGADVAALRAALGVLPGAPRDPRLGEAVIPLLPRADVPPRRRRI